MKKIAFLLSLIFFQNIVFSQRSKSTKTGNISLEELNMATYEKDPDARAVVLYEHGNLFIDETNDFDFTTNYYYRIKILKKEGVDKATIKIPFYKKERVYEIKGFTYNTIDGRTIKKDELSEDQIFTTELSDEWSEVSFTLPNVTEGSVIEFTYTLTTGYIQKINDWQFQDDIPKIKSEYDSAIMANYQYNIRLIGFLKLGKNEPSVLKKCVRVPGMGSPDCSVLSVGMNDIPAFKEENYMTHKVNFMSRISFELASLTNSDLTKIEYTEDWKTTDSKLKSNDFFGAELKRDNYFKKNLPPELFDIVDPLERAQKIYYFIQDHYTWNQKFNLYSDLNTKKSFDERIGSIGEINLALYNALKAANIETQIVLLATRDRGIPTKLHPVITDFNYVFVKVLIGNKNYFLDATDKLLLFGLTPFKTLNGDVRVMDFDRGSYWQENTPVVLSSKNVNLKLNILEEGSTSGQLNVVRTGYDALFLKNELTEKSKEQYLEQYESDYNLEISDYSISGKEASSPKVEENFIFTLENNIENYGTSSIIFNPFLHQRITVNPFKLEERLYPVDFGYKIAYTYRATIKIPNNYVVELPENKAQKLPNNGGSFIYSIKSSEATISIFFRYQLTKSYFSSEEYHYLKEFFNQIILIQKEPIILKKN